MTTINPETVKLIQALLSELNNTISLLQKLNETREISFSVGGITTKVNSKTDEESFNVIQKSLIETNTNKFYKLRDRINQLLYSDKGEIGVPKQLDNPTNLA